MKAIDKSLWRPVLVLWALLAGVLQVTPAMAQTIGMVVSSNPGSPNSVIVFDADSDTVLGAVTIIAPNPINQTLFDCSITADQSLGFVSDFFGGLLWVINLAGAPGLAGAPNPISMGIRPLDTTISPDQKFLLASGAFAPNAVTVVDIATRTVIGSYAAAQSVEACSDGSVLTTFENSGGPR